MKKTFKLQDEKKHPDRIIEAIKHEIRKYTKRERKKKLPDAEKMFWDFDCKFGNSIDSAEVVVFQGIIEGLDKTKELGWSECYIEILAKAVDKPLKTATPPDDEETDH